MASVFIIFQADSFFPSVLGTPSAITKAAWINETRFPSRAAENPTPLINAEFNFRQPIFSGDYGKDRRKAAEIFMVFRSVVSSLLGQGYSGDGGNVFLRG